MESLHYTMVDPQAAPVDLLDIVLPEDIYSLYTSAPLTEEIVDEEQPAEEAGIMTTVSNVIFSPINLLVYLIDLWVDGKIKKTLYEKF